MTRYRASTATEHASRYLQQLSKHWSHKLKVEFDPTHSRIEFDGGAVCTLDASDSRLDMLLEGEDRARVERLRGVVADHLKRFAFREDFEVEWHEEADSLHG